MKINFNEGGKIFTLYWNSKTGLFRVWFKPGWYRNGWNWNWSRS